MHRGQRRDEGRRWFERGLAAERAGDSAAAVEAYRRALEFDPGRREARNALAFYYQRHGMFAKAAEEFRAIARLSDDYFAHYNLGYVLVEMERYGEAEREFRRCLELEPNDPASYLEIAYIRAAGGDFNGSLAALQLPLERYNGDWEVYNLVGRCRIGLRDFSGAQDALREAWRLAPDVIAQGEILAQLGTLERYREFRQFESIKDQVYAEDGVVYLGSAGDDGLIMRELNQRDFTYPDIALTLQRLVAFLSSSRRAIGHVQALDAASRPLARALAEALQVSDVPEPEGHDQRMTLQVLAIGRSPELLSLARQRVDGPTMSFCLAVNWLRHSRLMPDVTGVIVHEQCSLPWDELLRNSGAADIDAAVERAADELLSVLRGQIPEANLSRQMRYYTRIHRRLTGVGALGESGFLSRSGHE